MRSHAIGLIGPSPTVIGLGLVAMVASAGLAACTYNFDKFAEVQGAAEVQDAKVAAGGSAGGAVDTASAGAPGRGSGGTISGSGGSANVQSATGGAAGLTSTADGAAGAPPMSGGGAGGAGESSGAGGMATGGVSSDGSGTGGSGTGGVGTGGTRLDGGAAGASGTGGMGTGGTRLDGGGTGGVGTGDASSYGGGGGGAGGMDGGGGTSPDPDLVLWYKFDESTGTTAADSAMVGGTSRNATLMTIGTDGSAIFSTAKQVGTHAVTLTPATTSPVTNGGYVTVAALEPLAPSALTVAVWVNLATNSVTQNWERIFDFGNGSASNNFLYLVARAGSPSTNPVQFVISTKGHSAASGQTITSPSALTPNVWHHIAIVLPAGSTYTGTMYIDGRAVATNTAMTLHASDLGTTTNNCLGRSQFTGASSGDPLFNGSLDDFRVYKRALSQQEISSLFAIR